MFQSLMTQSGMDVFALEAWSPREGLPGSMQVQSPDMYVK